METRKRIEELSTELKKQNQDSIARIEDQSKKTLSTTRRVTQRVGSELRQSTSKTLSDIGESAKKTVTQAPRMAISAIDPQLGMITDTIGSVVSRSFGFIRSIGQELTGEDQETQKQTQKTQEKISETRETNVEGFDKLNETIEFNFMELLAFLRGQSLEDLEREREEARNQKRLLEAVKDPGQPAVAEDEDSSGFRFLFLGKLKAVGPLLIKVLTPIAAAIGVIGGLLLAAQDQLQLIVRVFRGIAASVASVGRLFSTIFAPRAIAGTFTGIVGIFRSVVEGVRTAFTALSSGVGAVLTPIRAAVDTVRGFVSSMEGVSRGFQAVRGFLAPLGKTVGNVARAVRLIFVPLRFILIGFETLRGALDGFKEDGIIGGIQGAITGFFNGLIGIPADLITNALAWVTDRMGFSNAAAALREFSWTDLIGNLISAPLNLVRNSFSWIKNKFKEFDQAVERIGESIGEAIRNFFSGLSESISDLFSSMIGWVKNQFGFNEGEMPSIRDIFIGILTAPATLLRNAANWILGKFGLDDDMIPDPKDILMNIIMAPFRILENVRDWIADKVSGLGAIVSRLIPSPLKRLLGIGDTDDDEETEEDKVAKELPNRVNELADVSRELLSGTADAIGETASNIRDSVGGFVGGLFGGNDESADDESVEPTTSRGRGRSRGGSDSDVEIATTDLPARVAAARTLERSADERAEAQREADTVPPMQAQPAAQQGGNVNISTTNMSTGIIRNRPPASGTPDNASDAAFGLSVAP